MSAAPDLLQVLRRDDGVVILAAEAALFASRRDKEILAATERLLAEGVRRVVLDLGAVTSIDSSGLGNVVAAFNAVRGAEGRFALTGLSDHLRDLLSVTMLLPVIPSYPSAEEAARALTS